MRFLKTVSTESGKTRVSIGSGHDHCDRRWMEVGSGVDSLHVGRHHRQGDATA